MNNTGLGLHLYTTKEELDKIEKENIETININNNNFVSYETSTSSLDT